jgi:hypothetical protein
MLGRSEITKLMILLPLFHAFDKSIGIGLSPKRVNLGFDQSRGFTFAGDGRRQDDGAKLKVAEQSDQQNDGDRNSQQQ